MDEWSANEMFIQDVMRFWITFLKILLIMPQSMKNAVYSAKEKISWFGSHGLSWFSAKNYTI